MSNMTIQQDIQRLLDIWKQGCSCANKETPEQCPECTRGLIDAIERRAQSSAMNIPPNIHFVIERNPHSAVYQSVADHCAEGEFIEADDFDSPEAFKEACDTGELWTLQIYPTTPVGFWTCAAPTFEKLIALAWELHEQP